LGFFYALNFLIQLINCIFVKTKRKMITYTYHRDYTQQSENKVLAIIESLTTIKQCGPASKVIDLFETKFGETEFVKDMRNHLCDRTFELHKKKYTNNIVKT